jgi:hypothetical protein
VTRLVETPELDSVQTEEKIEAGDYQDHREQQGKTVIPQPGEKTAHRHSKMVFKRL